MKQLVQISRGKLWNQSCWKCSCIIWLTRCRSARVQSEQPPQDEAGQIYCWHVYVHRSYNRTWTLPTTMLCRSIQMLQKHVMRRSWVITIKTLINLTPPPVVMVVTNISQLWFRKALTVSLTPACLRLSALRSFWNLPSPSWSSCQAEPWPTV